jgi:predicted ABC-type transport system involved in lysophospholipase L1 biosynthesis ATPase subunit
LSAGNRIFDCGGCATPVATSSTVKSINRYDTAIIMTDATNSLEEFPISRPIIEVVRLTRTIQTPTHRVEILRGIDLAIPRGQFVAIMGPSGSGKSTLLGLLAGLDNATSGQLFLDGEDVTNFSEDRMAEVRGRKIGFVFQSFQLIPTLTAEENVLLPAELAGAGSEAADRARDLLTRVGLADRLDHYPVQLSGGEQQRVALAAPSSPGRPSCWPTSRPGIWMARRASRFWNFCWNSTGAKARRSCW